MNCQSKIIARKDFVLLQKKNYFRQKKIVFTNGCFDLLHAGHVLYLEEAASLGDYLIVGLNSDSSVRRLKGSKRPINNEQDRSTVLAGLSSVSFIIIFEEDTPYNLIAEILPDILVKGGDWQTGAIIGGDIVLQNGGKVQSLLYQEGKSTTKTIEKIML